MSLAARAADLRGNEFQHVLAWIYAVESLTNPDIISVSVEAQDGGAFDDIVVRKVAGTNVYEQAKSSNHGDKVVDEAWLFARLTERGKSPLQHFFATWREVSDRGEEAVFRLVTNRGFDHTNEILGQAKSNWDSSIDLSKLEGGPRSDANKALVRWSEHLGIEIEVLRTFLGQLRLVTVGDMAELYRAAGIAQRAAGLRGDEDAVTIGTSIVRRWVMTGVRTASRTDIATAIRDANLSDTTARVQVAVSGIDKFSGRAVAELDFVELYEGDEAQARRLLRSPDQWDQTVVPKMRELASRLESYGVHGVHLEGYARLPMWFALGRVFPRVRNWQLSTVQRGALWELTETKPLSPRISVDESGLGGSDVAVLIELSFAAESELREWIRSSGADIDRLLILQGDEIGNDSVPDPDWLMGWVEGARSEIRERLKPGQRVHLFLSAPSSAALALGHKWNLLPETFVYEYLPQEKGYGAIFSTL